MSKKTTYSVGDYVFTVKDTVMAFGDRILSRSFMIGGKKENCVTIGIMYNGSIPLYGKMSYVEANPSCSTGVDLPKGKDGTVIMIRTLLQHIHKELPTVRKVLLDDMSHIDCDPASGVAKLSLSNYYIVYNNKTWYEQYFQARLKDRKHFSEDGKDPEEHIPYHERYERAKDFLDSPKMKNIPFDEWKVKLGFAEELREAYDTSMVYREFFKKIPKEDRCKRIGRWLNTFMNIFMSDNFSNMEWEIDIPTFLALPQSGGRSRKYRKKGRHTRKVNKWRMYHGGVDYPVIGRLEDMDE